jgi:hypothetical protein
MNKHNITLGCDPEIFIENETEIVSAIGLIPGTKENPHPISDEGHSIQIDNIAMDFNIPPSHNIEEFKQHINFVKDHLQIIAKANNYQLSQKSSGIINPEYLKNPIAQQFGCDPDFDVYLQQVNEPPDCNTQLRSVGGHVHIGYPNPDNQETSEKIVKAFDMFVTLPSLLIDKDERRRELYGKAGCFRFKDFGVECRQLSNFWIHNDELIEFVYNNTIEAVNLVLDGEIDEFIEMFSEDVKNTINENNKEQAQVLIKKINQKKEEKNDKHNINSTINSL